METTKNTENTKEGERKFGEAGFREAAGYTPPMFSARVIEVIETTLQLAGNGTRDNPYRRITQYWSKSGQLLAQEDPYNPTSYELTLTQV